MRGIFSPHVIKKIMTGGVSLSHITFLGYWDALRRYHDVVATCCDVMRRVTINVVIRPTSRLRRSDKNIDFSWFSNHFIATSKRHDALRIKSEESQRRDYVAIVLWLRHDASRWNFDVAMHRDLRRDSEKIKKNLI